jgi:hypothetical protein
MMGMDQGQRSNAVGFNTSYLPNGEGSMNGGGTYTGNDVEPTIQDYENFFGPSARDIKTDLQRFKRHGRWHLPDILQGPNPWLTDRIDGLITDATNSPFTTKILPYRYKEEVDGKIKWNVWSFDEGMASRVPYESAARTLTQSKRSFAGYMVRQGMAIVLEHNFMMTPKGRENFKNQLNQLIGSIQYTNDLDVHMALILAPSYQKTMRERYYTSDKSASQLAREFADLFGMMQKNVNALDILIEEGKAILRTWGGPMPDFLLCNSKLTFQMTMTPEKTNYITQGIDGVKRLRQGPDLGSYRGLNIIHSRAFTMELGQHPRDVLRRRVRTAEYYRILPDKRNATREFELYNEERDNWFSLSFHDLLRYARYIHTGDDNGNAGKIDMVYHSLTSSPEKSTPLMHLGASALGGYIVADYPGDIDEFKRTLGNFLATINQPLAAKISSISNPISHDSDFRWYFRGICEPLVSWVPPRNNQIWDLYSAAVRGVADIEGLSRTKQPYLGVGPLKPHMMRNLYSALRTKTLNDPYSRGKKVVAGSAGWFSAFAFYQEVIKRCGISLDSLDYEIDENMNDAAVLAAIQGTTIKNRLPQQRDISAQFLHSFGAVGSVNHHMHLLDHGVNVSQAFADFSQGSNANTAGSYVGRWLILTVDVLEPLLSEYTSADGVRDTGLGFILSIVSKGTIPDASVVRMLDFAGKDNFLQFSSTKLPVLKEIITRLLAGFTRVAGVGVGELLSRNGISTIPLFNTTLSTLFSPFCVKGENGPRMSALRKLSEKSSGHFSTEMVTYMADNSVDLVDEVEFPWFVNADMRIRSTNTPAAVQMPAAPGQGRAAPSLGGHLLDLFKVIGQRIHEDPVFTHPIVSNPAGRTAARIGVLEEFMAYGPRLTLETQCILRFPVLSEAFKLQNRVLTSMTPDMVNISIDMNDFFDTPPPGDSGGGVQARVDPPYPIENVEIVIIRPNIEHNMLGVIMGLGGNELGNTLWGQTELSVYDDSMHGIWGMSYKYHERAIVFNEKNLIRMWDIAYDGYNGGKDDTYVDWTDESGSKSNGYGSFKEHTVDLSKNYRGPSMMVMAFVHDKHRSSEESGQTVFNDEFRRNWPSPIVFYDSFNGRDKSKEALPLDYDNVQTVDVEEFRVFNNSLYSKPYSEYREMMPDFRTMHLTRKSAGQSSADAETATDCLAFQGSMRIKDGVSVQEIHGSGHHGPDYTGVASVRAGKGQKVSGQAPILSRLV